MKATMTRMFGVLVALAGIMASPGCGDVARTGRSPVQAVIGTLEAASGARPGEFGGTLRSDVITFVNRTINGVLTPVPTTFNDIGRVSIRLVLKDPGVPGIAAVPSPLNEVTFTRYRVIYRRADGRNTPGVDVPHPLDSAATFTVPGVGSIIVGFDIVRHTAKDEAPLQALANSDVIISTIAEVTFFGSDQAGNEVIVTGSIGIFFGNFGDPT